MPSVAVKRADAKAPTPVAPAPLWQSLLLFGVPAVLFRLVLYNGTGWLEGHGVSEAVAVIMAFLIPSVLLLTASLVALVARLHLSTSGTGIGAADMASARCALGGLSLGGRYQR